MTQSVELEYKNKLFKLNLTPYEIEKCQNDAAFYEEIGAKYYRMYQHGHVSARDLENNTNWENVEEINEFIEDGPTQTSSDYEKFIWPRPAVLILLAELEKRKTVLMQPHKKRVLFGEIASVLQRHDYKVVWESCERKWRGMQATYKKMLNKQSKTGSNAIRWEFYDAVANIIENDPAYNPLATVSIGVVNVATMSAQAMGTKKNNPTTSNSIENKSEDSNVSAQAVVTKKNASISNSNNKNKDGNEICSKLNDELKEIRSAMNDCNKIQGERNVILARIATALEKLSDQ